MPIHRLFLTRFLSHLIGCSLLVCFLNSEILAVTSIPFTADFESPEFTPGILISDPDWSFDANELDVAVVATDSVSPDPLTLGTQSLGLTGDEALSLDLVDALSGQIRWIDFYVKPIFVALPEVSFSIGSQNSAAVGFVIDGTVGQIYAVDGDGLGNGIWVSAEVPISMIGQTSLDWVRLAYRVDYANKRWDLYINNRPVLLNLGFLDDNFIQFDEVALSGDATHTTAFDHFYVGDTSQVDLDGDGIAELDTDNDGIADIYETANGLNLLVDDRLGDLDNDTLLNLEEYALGRLASVADADVSLYTDANLGHDLNYSGLSAVPKMPTSADGPKASVESALTTASDGDIILLQSGSYDETTLDPDGKVLTVRPNGTVTLY